MTWKKYSTVAVVALTLVGCSNMNGTEQGAANRDRNHHVEQTRYYNNAGEGMTNVRNYTHENGNRMHNDYYRNINNPTDGNINNETRYHVDKEAADKIVRDVKHVDRAHVLTSGHNAYVAVGVKDANVNQNRNHDRNRDELPNDVKNEISRIVKSVDKNIDKVYVSAHPEFFNLTHNYVEDVRSGHPVEGFFDQFGNMVQRLFPHHTR
ncbi:YhcN/YlaJ family sporulation lipoprotein [Oceanobacillus chungangensis]|uniref:YhcN/YlaJ family sporulation lipoprotein n=1 Tax=Oceanobacillus chungangensis TaxID=1229152 RepID=A0A3D8PX50_9BACI|nr:YhcN/YlaJ family sporulation lipoprotein [Oceanobacillus chungangensis]RDW19858.1 hypothetical protein CWR45_07290 [Oceanobacillus chungangensis]